MDEVTIRRCDAGGLDEIRDDLLTLYAKVYADRLEEEFHSIGRFAERLGWNAEMPGFAAAVGHLVGDPVGCAYGCTLPPGTRWWAGLRTAVPAHETAETGSRTFAVSELMAVAGVRGTGVARRLHDELLRGRPEERATLLVDRDHVRVRVRYEEWGYRWLGEVQPFPDAPVYDAMLLSLTV